MLYRLRERHRVWYGCLESLVALAGVVYLLKGLAENLHDMADAPLVARMAVIFAAVYVMVRALDNIGSELKDSKVAGRWNWILK
jgi:hypothetical protein